MSKQCKLNFFLHFPVMLSEVDCWFKRLVHHWQTG